MAKTALELTPEELKAYKPLAPNPSPGDLDRWERAWAHARTVARLLREKFGATRVVVFGSLTDRACFTQWSDIDLAAWGITPDDYYRAVAFVTGLSSEFELDLVDPACTRPALQKSIEREGIDV